MKKKVVSVMLLVALVGSSLSATTITAYAEDHDPVNLTFWGWTASDFELRVSRMDWMHFRKNIHG